MSALNHTLLAQSNSGSLGPVVNSRYLDLMLTLPGLQESLADGQWDWRNNYLRANKRFERHFTRAQALFPKAGILPPKTARTLISFL